ncbi:MAG TPA: sigma-70 family RNA polymerase sigma factor [Gemmataceae bacterium]|nr:sigma-70 family RNA polymerase sigma factor [Gemmataceae bacterium]
MPATRLDGVFAAGVTLPRPDPRPDADLLTRFLDDRDDTAFEALVARHTPALRAVCRGWLRDPTDVDDAVQATFLVLVRRAASIRNRVVLGVWLCAVAENVARRLKAQLARTTPLEHDVPGRPQLPNDGTAELVAEEVTRLPEKYRRPVQLCYLAGLTTVQAAEQLGWPKGTVLTRLDRAKKQLHRRLLARGAAPAVLASYLTSRATAINPWWVWGTVRAARGVLTGAAPADLGVSERTLSLTEGVVHAMLWNKLKLWAALTLFAAAVIGFGLGRWATAAPAGPDDRKDPAAGPTEPGAVKPSALAAKERQTPAPSPATERVAAPEVPKAGVPGKRREAVIKLPLGTFVKEVDFPPYGSGRIAWTYEEDRVLGTIEGSVMGVEFEVHTEAEFALSSNGTIYGILTGFKISHLKFPAQGELAQIGEYAGLWPLFEPLVAEVLTDLPFSYQFRVQGDRLVISNFRALLAGPNPLGKLGGLAAAERGDGKEALQALAMFQGLAMIMEGTYTAPDGKEPAKRKPVVPFVPRKRSVYGPPAGVGDATGAPIGPATANHGTGAAIGQAAGAITGGLVGNEQNSPATIPPAENK